MNDQHQQPAPTSQTLRIAAAWTVVAIPLAYGLITTIKNTLPLFGG